MTVVITSGYVLGHQRSSKKMMAGPPPASGFRTSRVTGVIRAPRVLGEQTRLTCPGVREAAGGGVGELEGELASWSRFPAGVQPAQRLPVEGAVSGQVTLS